jgi:Flp pilus assembly protein TadB
MFGATPPRHPRGVKNGGRLHRAIEANMKREREAKEARERRRQAEKAAQEEAEIRRRLDSHDSEEEIEVRKVDMGEGDGSTGAERWKICCCSLLSMLVVIFVYWMGWL